MVSIIATSNIATVLSLKGNYTGAGNNNTSMQFVGLTSGTPLWTVGNDITTNNGTNDFSLYANTTSTAILKLTQAGAATFSSSVTQSGFLDILGGSLSSTNGLHQWFNTSTNQAWIQAFQSGVDWRQINYNGAVHNFLINDVTTLYVSNSRNVGIGNNSPITMGNTTTLQVGNGTTAGFIGLNNRSGGFTTPASFDGLLMGSAYDVTYIYANNFATSTWRDMYILSQNTIFQTNGSERMRITSGGNVGIGSGAPQTSLEVSGGNTYFPAKIITLSGAESTRYNGFMGLNLIGGSQLAMSFGTRSNNTDYANTLNLFQGNVLIGTTTDSGQRFQVSGGQSYFYHNTTNYDVMYIVNQSSSPYGMNITFSGAAPNNNTNNFLYFADTSGLKFRVTSSGTIASGIWNGTAIADAYIASAATWNAKQGAITLTTTGTSGVATPDVPVVVNVIGA